MKGKIVIHQNVTQNCKENPYGFPFCCFGLHSGGGQFFFFILKDGHSFGHYVEAAQTSDSTDTVHLLPVIKMVIGPRDHQVGVVIEASCASMFFPHAGRTWSHGYGLENMVLMAVAIASNTKRIFSAKLLVNVSRPFSYSETFLWRCFRCQ